MDEPSATIKAPQSSYRGQTITFQEFSDLTFVGMAGLSEHLLKDQLSPFNDGMVNYKLIADALGLVYDERWLDKFSHSLENRLESLITHDTAPNGAKDNGCWVYLNSGFHQIAKHLDAKYYTPESFRKLSYEEFRDVLLFELVGMAQDQVDQNGQFSANDEFRSYDIRGVAEHFGLAFEAGWIAAVEKEWVKADYINSVDDGRTQEDGRFVVTHGGYKHAQSLLESLSQADGLLLTQGNGELFFSVDASHISRLGMELVAKQETAVAELVKNGYDADATNVDLIFSTADSIYSTLEIFDNGTGMTLDELEAGFMRLSTPNKVAAPTSDLFKRQKAGRKGIGRFAAQRLGRKLVLETATTSMHYALKLTIDWDEFSAERNLSSVPSIIERIPKTFEHGTKLTILHLRDSWSDAQIERSHRHIAELIQPFPLADIAKSEGSDPGFKASFTRICDDDLVIIADDWSLYFKHALAEIEGKVDENGYGYWSLRSKKFGIEVLDQPIGLNRNEPSEQYPNLRSVKFKAFYYIDKETQRSFRAKVADKLQSSGGVRLYRNGFRVLPYGERFDDWLKLNASNLLRKILPPHSNRNFLGFVEINDVDGSFFEETSSREGLLENESFGELKDFVSSSLKSAILPIADARDRRRTTTETRRSKRSPKGQADDIITRLEALQSNARDNPEYAAALSDVVSTVKNSVIEIGDVGETLLQDLGMMRVLASLGLAIGEFTHEIGLALESVKATASLLASDLNGDTSYSDRASNLVDQISDFEGYLAYFDHTVRENVSREVVSLETRDVVNSFVKVVEPKINRNELKLASSYDGYGLFMKPMHRSEWASILINLFTNSVKAIRRAGHPGQISIDCGRIEEGIYLDFSDNGDGIPEANKNKIFDSFFTTTSAAGARDDDETLAGMGMGLKIVKDIVDTVGGNISLRPAKSPFTTCLRVIIPEATDEEVPSDDY